MLYLLLSAEFVAAAQVLVYAGAVMVMFLFVIAYLGPRRRAAVGERAELADARRGARVGRDLRRDHRRARAEGRRPARVEPGGRLRLRPPGWIGRLFLTDHLLAFEITSIVLLVAAVGGVVLGSHTRREVRGEMD